MSPFKDYFSGHARAYALARPGYPDALIDWLAGVAPDHRLAWDAATGNGQAARCLGRHFLRVHASDASADQIAAARPADGVRYVTEPAEDCSLDDQSCDLVCVAQAAHWLDLERFYAEVRRVTRPGGVLALWCYGNHSVAPEVDAIVNQLYSDTLGEFWAPERRLIESGYRDLPFPFRLMETPNFSMSMAWNLAAFLSYLRSWSASQRYLRERGEDPVDSIAERLTQCWGDGSRTVIWPIHIKATTL